jgi:hypothetical protein
MVVAADWLAANVAAGRAAHTMHHITALGLEEPFATLVTHSDNALRDTVLDPRAHVHLLLFFYLVAPQRQVVRLIAFS